MSASRDPSAEELYSLRLAPELARLLEKPRPWMTHGAVDWLERHLPASGIGLEFGGGSSTPFFAERLARLHTVEANPAWALVLLHWFQDRPELLRRWRLHVVPADWQTPRRLRSVWRAHGHLLEAEDIANLEKDYLVLPSERFDLIAVDGALRPRCIARAAAHALAGETRLLVVDNTESRAIAEAVARFVPAAFRRLDFPADSRDDIPPWQEGRWITSVFVREDA